MWLFVLYRKATRVEMGWAADYCPIQRDITAQRVAAVHDSRYVTFFRVSRGKILRYERTCRECGCTLTEKALSYKGLIPEGEENIGEMEMRTNPGVPERHGEFLELRREIEGGGAIDLDLKMALVREQFALLEQVAAQQWRGQTNLDRTTVIWAGVSFLVFIGGMAAMARIGDENRQTDALGWVLGGALLLLIANAVVFFRAPARAVRRKVLPLTAAALRPLRLSREELEELLARMREEGFAHATKVKSAELMALIPRRPGG